MTYCNRKTITKEHIVRNPATGEDLMREPRKAEPFNCSDKLREMVNRQ